MADLNLNPGPIPQPYRPWIRPGWVPIARAIGHPNVTFDAALATRTTLTMTFDAALATRITTSMTWDTLLAPDIQKTVTFDAALALRTLATATFDAALGLRTTKSATFDAVLAPDIQTTLTFDATLALRTLKTVTFDAALSLRTSPFVTWDAAIGLIDVFPAATDAEIAASLAGVRGAVAIRFRFEQRNHDFEFQADVTPAVELASIALNNSSVVTRTAAFKIRTERLPDDFDLDNDHIAVFAELLVHTQYTNEYVRFSLGLFHLDRITGHASPNSNDYLDATGADVSIHLTENSITQPYTIPAGSLYTDEVDRLVRLNGLRTNVFPSGLRTPTAFTWPLGKTHADIVNDLLEGINYYPIWADGEGVCTSRPRGNPSQQIPDVAYTTLEAPRMIRPDFQRSRQRARFTNQVVVAIQDVSRAPSSVRVTNNDDDSIVSTVNKHATTTSQLSGDRTPNQQLMFDIGTWAVRESAIKAQLAQLQTHPDLRRDAHEYYLVTVEDTEEATLWRAEGWSLNLQTGATMSHQIGRAEQVDVELEVIR